MPSKLPVHFCSHHLPCYALIKMISQSRQPCSGILIFKSVRRTMNREPKPFVKILMSYWVFQLFFFFFFECVLFFLFKLMYFECFIVSNVKRQSRLIDWIIKYITGAKGRLLKAPLLSIYLSLLDGKLRRQLCYLVYCDSLSPLHNQWYFLVAFCFHCCMCSVCDQRSHIGIWVRMFIWSSVFFFLRKLWYLHGLENVIPLAVRTVIPLRREKVGLLILQMTKTKQKKSLFWEQNYSVAYREYCGFKGLYILGIRVWVLYLLYPKPQLPRAVPFLPSPLPDSQPKAALSSLQSILTVSRISCKPPCKK